ncbi:DUF3231 family protein [Pseudalkalibacillus decolorationis]|uniref:DUF3231 family protein n=1 Tax=Pseudalkalibacillus decolorationis TaxID=163879 RepID=UPI0021473656|nr:DUF3231 family protein [Pseudalkalibacillus decolorationis]
MNDIPLSSSELGNIWQAYQEKSMKLHFLEHFIENSNESAAKDILQSAYNIESKNKKAIEAIFQNAGAVIPVAFTEKDVFKKAPRLFDESFDLMYIRNLSKILIGLYALHSGMSYREDICELYKDFTSDSQMIYTQTTQYLLNKGVLPRPPIVPMPNKVEFVEDTSYTNGSKFLGSKRVLNTVEIGLVYQSLETNILGVKLMTGFAQVAKNSDAKKYFQRGKELAKKQISIMSDLLLETDIQAPSTWTGIVTDSTISPFSDKMMMYNTNLLSIFGLGSNSVGAAFSFRGDLLLKMGRIMTNIFDFAKDGGEIIIKNGWMEEPPQAADRTKLSKGQSK